MGARKRKNKLACFIRVMVPKPILSELICANLCFSVSYFSLRSL